jgi:uncharacterized protein
MEHIIGRKEEFELLRTLKERKRSSFVAVFGRRRVGKTFLINNVYEEKFTFKLTGLAKVGFKHQLSNFHTALVEHNEIMQGQKPAKDWFEAFTQLRTYLATSKEEKKTVFLDELPWLDTPQSGFIPALEHFWNSWASARQDILLIVCGSAASWMIKNLLNSRGGLHNRVTHRIKLEPFTLSECEEFFKDRGGVFSRYLIIQLYMALGGVPYYLDFVDTGKSAAQNINALCFTPNGALRTEFDNLYASLFKNSHKHIAVIEALSTKAKGMERMELLQKANLSDGGSATKVLKELEESSFIRRYTNFDKKEKNALYQLCDFYSFFYLKFIKDSNPLDKNLWINSIDSPNYRSWSGYAFEQVCLSHIEEIKFALGISGIQTNTTAWLGDNGTQKAQIDLVIDRRDQVITLCEMKFSINSFVIDKKYAEELRNKIGVFKSATQTNKAVFLAMVTTFGVSSNEYSTSLVQNSLTMDVLFRKLED